MAGYSRAGIAAEAGVETETITVAVREGRLDDTSPYQVVRYIASRRCAELREAGVDVDKGLELLDGLEALSRSRLIKLEFAAELERRGAG